MKEILRTNDAVLVSAVEALLEGAYIPYLVLDQNMPQMTGLELAAKLRAQGMAIRCCLSGGALSPAAREPDHGVGAFNPQ